MNTVLTYFESLGHWSTARQSQRTWNFLAWQRLSELLMSFCLNFQTLNRLPVLQTQENHKILKFLSSCLFGCVSLRSGLVSLLWAQVQIFIANHISTFRASLITGPVSGISMLKNSMLSIVFDDPETNNWFQVHWLEKKPGTFVHGSSNVWFQFLWESARSSLVTWNRQEQRSLFRKRK